MTQDLMSKVTLDKYPNATLHPKLETILLELTHHNPVLTYVATGTLSRPDGSSRVCRVAVFDGISPVGVIEVEMRYSSRLGNDMVYSVCSDNITTRRGRRGWKQTKHLKEAMKTIKEAFKPEEESKIVEAIVNSADNKLSSITRWAKNHAQGAVVNAFEPLLAYLTAVHDGVHTANTLPPTVTDALGGRWHEYAGNMRIASAVRKQFDAGYGAVARIERDGTINVVDLMTKKLIPCQSTYDLPTNYQEKITILKLMDENQPIEHVGVRFTESSSRNNVRLEYDMFFLVGGETHTTH